MRACSKDLEPGHPGHLVVEDHQIERLFPHQLHRGLAAVGALDGVAERLEDVDAQDDDRTGVVDDQDLGLGRGQFAWANAGESVALPLVRVS